MRDPASQVRPTAAFADQRLSADDSRLPFAAFLGRDLLLSALVAENPPVSPDLGRNRAAHAAEHPPMLPET
jgi:hypothetical protein